jgi:hypothetical protein
MSLPSPWQLNAWGGKCSALMGFLAETHQLETGEDGAQCWHRALYGTLHCTALYCTALGRAKWTPSAPQYSSPHQLLPPVIHGHTAPAVGHTAPPAARPLLGLFLTILTCQAMPIGILCLEMWERIHSLSSDRDLAKPTPAGSALIVDLKLRTKEECYLRGRRIPRD